jgi:hypothetical protein
VNGECEGRHRDYNTFTKTQVSNHSCCSKTVFLFPVLYLPQRITKHEGPQPIPTLKVPEALVPTKKINPLKFDWGIRSCMGPPKGFLIKVLHVLGCFGMVGLLVYCGPEELAAFRSPLCDVSMLKHSLV